MVSLALRSAIIAQLRGTQSNFKKRCKLKDMTRFRTSFATFTGSAAAAAGVSRQSLVASMFTDRLYDEAQRLGLNTIEVDPSMTEDDLTARVLRAFGL